MNEVRIGSGIDVHPFSAQDRPLVLAGVTVPDAPGLEGHSDGDVVTHAVTDALLGALALGDLGSRFGVDAAELEGADSMKLLASVARDVFDAGWRTGNVDLTVVAQRPRLAPFRDRMRAQLGDVLGTDAVSVKFTTTDQLGSIGRAEGIACWATVLLQR